MKKLVWLAYDLGIKGDYEGLYAWLDGKGARECGDCVAVLTYDYQQDLASELLDDLKRRVSTDSRTRFYHVIDGYRSPERR